MPNLKQVNTQLRAAHTTHASLKPCNSTQHEQMCKGQTMVMVIHGVHLVTEHPRQWSETTGECEAEEREGEEGQVIQERVVAGTFHGGIK